MAIPVSFLSDQWRLVGELHLPETSGPWPGLCICHGIPAVPFNPEDTGYRQVAARFAAAGFSTLLFHFRGAGLSEGNFDMLGWSRDLSAAITFLSHTDHVDMSKIFVMGFSGGAAAGIHLAARDERVKGVVSCASPAHFRDLIEEPALSECLRRWREIGIIRDPGFPPNLADWVSGFVEVTPVRHAGRIAPRPLLLIHGAADDVVPLSHAYELYDAAAEPRHLEILTDGVHRLRVDDRAITIALRWLRKHASA